MIGVEIDKNQTFEFKLRRNLSYGKSQIEIFTIYAKYEYLKIIHEPEKISVPTPNLLTHPNIISRFRDC